MLWVIQDNLYNEYGYKIFMEALDRMGSNYIIVKPVPFSNTLLPSDFDSMKQNIEDVEEPKIDTNQNIVVCGAITLAKIAKNRGWKPGSFLNENFDFSKWRDGFGKDNMLNGDAVVGKLKDMVCNQKYIFARPVKDTKAFTGTVMSKIYFDSWKQNMMDLEPSEFTPLHKDTEIMISSIKKINAEYRLFVINGKVVTGSIYKLGGMGVSQLHKLNSNFQPDEEILDMANRMINKWMPAKNFVLDIAKTDEGPKVIEINNLNSAGFYSSDVFKIIAAMEEMYE